VERVKLLTNDTRRIAANDDDGPVVTMTRREFGTLLRRAVQEERAHSGPVLMDKQGMAQHLGCSPAHIDHLRKKGLPSVSIGKVIRFEPDKVIEWLRSQSKAG
jgi:hypothetical protein